MAHKLFAKNASPGPLVMAACLFGLLTASPASAAQDQGNLADLAQDLSENPDKMAARCDGVLSAVIGVAQAPDLDLTTLGNLLAQSAAAGCSGHARDAQRLPGAKVCPETAAVGNVALRIYAPIIEFERTHDEVGFGSVGKEQEGAPHVAVRGIGIGLDMTGGFGFGFIAGTPIPVDGGASVTCGYAGADICYKDFCLNADAGVACDGHATGHLIDTPQLKVSFAAYGQGFAPCRLEDPLDPVVIEEPAVGHILPKACSKVGWQPSGAACTPNLGGGVPVNVDKLRDVIAGKRDDILALLPPGTT